MIALNRIKRPIASPAVRASSPRNASHCIPAEAMGEIGVGAQPDVFQ